MPVRTRSRDDRSGQSRRGAPYPLFLPVETGESGMRYSLAIRTIAWVSSVEPGRTTADGAWAAASVTGYGSR